jgi:AcrR family transcriptional regulator
MARPKEFDRYQALQAAISVFRNQSYAATSIDDLLNAMNIGRQSFYDTFGDKRSLYIEALTIYLDESYQHIVRSVKNASSPLQALHELIFSAAGENSEARALGCMGISTICEFGSRDEEITAIGRKGSKRMELALQEVIAQAKILGEIPPAQNETHAARFVMSILIGMRVRAREGCEPEFLRDLATFTVNSLHADIFKYMP